MRTKEQTQVVKRLENQVDSLTDKNKKLEKEMILRGIEITKMIKIFVMIKHMLPEGPREELHKIAKGYAARCDEGRGKSYCPGQIDFRESFHSG